MMPYYQPGYAPAQVPAPQAVPGARTASTSVSIWAGDLDSYMDETFLRNAVAACGWAADITRIKVVRDRYSGMHAGYGFLDAASQEAAARVLATGSGMPIPGTNRCWRLNMGRNAQGASGGVPGTAVSSGSSVHGGGIGPAIGGMGMGMGMNMGLNMGMGVVGGGIVPGIGAGGGPGSVAAAETNIYVGDLEPTVTDFELMSAFRPRFPSTRHAKVVCNDFGQSRGFGFVRFANAVEAERAVLEMNGFEFHGKPIRLSPANGRPRNGSGPSGSGGHVGHQQQHHHGGSRGGMVGQYGAPHHMMQHMPYGGGGGMGAGLQTNKRPRQVLSPDDPSNTSLFIGGTGPHVTEDVLWREFSIFGELEAARVPVNKTGFAFVRFKTREAAQRAKDDLSGTHFISLNASKPVRVEFASEQLSIQKPPPSAAHGGQQSFSPFVYNQGVGGHNAVHAPSSMAAKTSTLAVAPSSSPRTANSDDEECHGNASTIAAGATTLSSDMDGIPESVAAATIETDGPPCKRAAVGRPEYEQDAPGAEFAPANGSAPEAVANMLPWLNAAQSAPSTTPQ
jgi:RNA recognition motif-containing protein